MKKFIILFFLIFISFDLVFAINFSATWDFSKAKETPTHKIQTYSFSFSKDLSLFMNFGGSLNYSKSEMEDTWRESLYPAFYYNLVSDLFSYNLSYSYSITNLDTGANYMGWALSSFLRTSIKETDISLFWNKGKNWSEGLKTNIETSSKTYGFYINRSFKEMFLKGLSTSINYTKSESKDYVTDAKTQNTYSSLRLSYLKSFKNISFGINQEFYKSKSEGWYKISGRGYKVEYDLSLTNGTFNATLNVGDIFYLQFPPDYILEGIDLYTDYSIREKIGSSARWDIYYSRDKINWTQVATNVVLPYEFPSPLTYPNIYLKLEVRWVSGTIDLRDPKFVGYYYETEAHTKREDKYSKTNANLSIKLPYKSYFSSSVNWEDYEYEITPGRRRFYYNLSFSNSKSKYFRPSFSYFYSEEKPEDREKDKYQGFSINVSSLPLDTVTLGSGYSYTKSWYNGTAQSKNQNIFFSGSFEIYPDLTLNLNQNYSKIKNLETGEVTTSYGTFLNFLARLKPTITLELRNSYVKSKTEKKETTTWRYEGFLNWQISDILLFSTSQTYQTREGREIYTYFYTVFIGPTRELRINLSFSGFSEEESRGYNLGFNIFWIVTPKLNMIWNYNYSKTDEEHDWSWHFRISYVF